MAINSESVATVQLIWNNSIFKVAILMRCVHCGEEMHVPHVSMDPSNTKKERNLFVIRHLGVLMSYWKSQWNSLLIYKSDLSVHVNVATENIYKS